MKSLMLGQFQIAFLKSQTLSGAQNFGL